MLKFEKNKKSTAKKPQKNGVSAGGLEKQIFSRETLLLRGGRKGDPDTKSGLGKKLVGGAKTIGISSKISAAVDLGFDLKVQGFFS